jgi:hypothetical protein
MTVVGKFQNDLDDQDLMLATVQLTELVKWEVLTQFYSVANLLFNLLITLQRFRVLVELRAIPLYFHLFLPNGFSVLYLLFLNVPHVETLINFLYLILTYF